MEIFRDDPFWRPGFVSADRVSRSNSESSHVCQLKFSGSQSTRDRIAKASMYANFEKKHPRWSFPHRCQPGNVGFLLYKFFVLVRL